MALEDAKENYKENRTREGARDHLCSPDLS
jgi:hypothetical protein